MEENLFIQIRQYINTHRLTAGIIALFLTVCTYKMCRYNWFFTIPMFCCAYWAHDSVYVAYKGYRYIMTGVASIFYGIIALGIGTYFYEAWNRSMGLPIVIVAAFITFFLSQYALYRDFKRVVAEDDTLNLIKLSTDKLSIYTAVASTILFIAITIYWVIHFELLGPYRPNF
jgi:hypothetical protein